MGQTCGFYQLRMVSNDTTVLVPVENADNVGLRKAVGNQEVDRLFNLLGDGKIDTHQNWKGRFKDNSDRMRTGSLFDVVEVLKSLTYLARSKNLSFREKRMLDRAKFLVISEIAEVTHDVLPVVESRVEQALERSCTSKSKALARQAAIKAAKVTTVEPSAMVRRTRRARRTSRRVLPRLHTRRRPGRMYRPGPLRDGSDRCSGTSLAAVRTLLVLLWVSVYTRPPRRARHSVRVALQVAEPSVPPGGRRGARRVLDGWHPDRRRGPGAHHRRGPPSTASITRATSSLRPLPGAAARSCRTSSSSTRPSCRKLPILGPGFNLVGFVPVERGNRDQSSQALDPRSTAWRRASRSWCSRRARGAGRASSCRSRRARFWWRCGRRRRWCRSPSRGHAQAMRKGSPLIIPVTVRVKLGPPIETTGLGPEATRRPDRLGSQRFRADARRHPRVSAGRASWIVLITLGRTLGFSFAAGVNLYATVAVLGLAVRYDWVDLPAAVRRLRQQLRDWCGDRALRRSSSSPTRCRGSIACGIRSIRRFVRSAAR